MSGGCRVSGQTLLLPDTATELDAIAAAGGLTVGADRRLEIRRGEQRFIHDLTKALDAGSGAVALRDGDHVIVPEATMSSLNTALFNRVLFDYIYRTRKGIALTPGWWRVPYAPTEAKL